MKKHRWGKINERTTLIRETQANLRAYRKELAQRDRALVSREDIRNKKLSFTQKKGGIPYLAVESHSVSRRVLHSDIESAWVRELYPIGQAPKVKVKFPGST